MREKFVRNSFKVINNATTLINEDFIIDPWIYGSLYNNSWSPYPKPTFDKKKLKKTKFCFISHIHQDHWDLDTIKYFNKNIIFFIPNLIFNKVIENTLKKRGYYNIVYLQFKKFHKISNNYRISIVPPLNTNALETDKIDKKDSGAIAIDTGIIVNFLKDNSNHLILTDNSPYDLKIYKKYFDKIRIDSVFFPYNGFAQDYPLCYDNFSLNEKKKISKEMSLKKEKYLIKFLKYLKPKVAIPHSSDFQLNIRSNLFEKIHSKTFLNKDLYSQRIKKITGIKSYPLYSKDTLYFSKKSFFADIKSTLKDKKNRLKKKKLSFPKIHKNKNFIELLKICLIKYSERLKKYKLDIKKIINCNFLITIDKKNYFINLKKMEISINPNFKKKKLIILKTRQDIAQAILERKIHINNAQIACYLNWNRYPKNYLTTKNLYESLSFLHI